MQALPEDPLRTLDDVARFEAALPLEKRLPGRSIYYVFVAAAERDPKATAITMVMTGAPDEQPRRVNYAELLSLVRRAANLFASLGGKRPGVARQAAVPQVQQALSGFLLEVEVSAQ